MYAMVVGKEFFTGPTMLFSRRLTSNGKIVNDTVALGKIESYYETWWVGKNMPEEGKESRKKLAT